MNGHSVPHSTRFSRRLVLGAAAALAIGVFLCLDPSSAEESRLGARAPAPVAAAGQSEATKEDIEINIAPRPRRDGGKAGAADSSDDAAKAPPESRRTIVVKKGDKTITVTGGPDHEFDSVDELVKKDPALAGMIFGIVAVVFLAPVLAIALILGYRMRKARMLNETMLKLAEKGIVPPAEAFGAVMNNTLPPAGGGASTPVSTSLQEQAKAMRRRTVWSDLRKGVVMGAIGLGLTAHSEMSDSTPSVIGMILLFVGIGYVALWWFEQRRLDPPGGTAGNERGPGAP